MAKEFRMFINGKWVKSQSGEAFEDRNPADTRDLVGVFQKGNSEDVKAAVDAAEMAYDAWSSTPAPKRAEILFKVSRTLKERKEELAKLMTREMGKVLKESRGDVQEAIDIFEYCAGEGRRLWGRTTPSELRDKFCMTIRRPIGVCGLITPWNFPIAIPAWKSSAALISGNTIVFKPASDTPLCATRLAEILQECGLPPGVFNMVTGPGETVGKEIATNKKIRAISFTGSKETGAWIQREAGGRLKRVSLELGGKNPIIVMDDADLSLALDGVIWGAFGTSGQRCTACSRVIAHEKVEKEFTRMLAARTKKLRLGDGLKPTTDIGPLINKSQLEKVARYGEIGRKEGARLLCGGEIAKEGALAKGYFYKPTIFTGVSADMRIAQEEIFGPMLSVISAKNLDEAIEIANSVEYGLSSSIYTGSMTNAFRAIGRIEAGITYVNASTIGAETHLPFGGVKHTGNAREAGWAAIEEFTEEKAVYIDYSGKLQKATID